MMELKEKIFKKVEEILSKKSGEMQIQLAQIRLDAASSAKGSMGDKYETTREMLKQEEGKVAQQLILCEKQIAIVRSHQIRRYDQVKAGAMLKSGDFYFLLLTSIGKVSLEGKDVFVVSPISPIGKILLDKKTGDKFLFNRKDCEIDEIA